ncbi:haloacid dehalogenase superfamily, subfamily IA, variant 3 with third motif having DD or ED [Rhizobiales bacterium GAS113]|jgi:HAD superfamily hydrolase (TIGR01509 family)|nr:haloacid dehalogenase superfamily, subfamily IA, variant 3 with third motif having DD or ED [Rhizobiales bacterium GAS113]
MPLLIFDCDGVLVDSEYLFARVASECLAEIGIAIDAGEAARRFAGVSLKDILAAVERERGLALPAGFEAYLISREDEAYARLLEPIAGVRDAILSIGLPRCVASSSLPDRISESLVVTKLDDLFGEEARFSTALVANGKPAPDIFLYAAQHMRKAPEACIVVEDSVPGVIGGVAAGMRVVGFVGGRHCGQDHGQRLTAAGAHIVIAEMAQLQPAVQSLIAKS